MGRRVVQRLVLRLLDFGLSRALSLVHPLAEPAGEKVSGQGGHGSRFSTDTWECACTRRTASRFLSYTF